MQQGDTRAQQPTAISADSARDAELSFYAQILGFEPAGDVPTLAIEHLR